MSTVNQIMKRCAFFSFFFLIMFLIYIVFHQNISGIATTIPFPREYSPLFVWLLFFGYLFFPSKKYLNGRGRRYLWNLMIEVFCFACYKIDFRILWATDQLVSFVIPLQDLEFTACYYFFKWKGDNPLDQCQHKSFSIGNFVKKYYN